MRVFRKMVSIHVNNDSKFLKIYFGGQEDSDRSLRNEGINREANGMNL